jgi:hypothetical protein
MRKRARAKDHVVSVPALLVAGVAQGMQMCLQTSHVGHIIEPLAAAAPVLLYRL